MVGLYSAIFPPAPTFTEKDLENQSGKVFIITGAASGVGYELAKILYNKNGTVYVAARSSNRANEAIKKLQAEVPNCKGQLMPLVLDLADLPTIKPAVETFLKEQSRLDVLVHNAGVMEPPVGSKTKLGHDLEMGTHTLGPYVLTCLLETVLKRTAMSTTKPYSVRIVWVVSLIQFGTPQGAMLFDDEGTPKVLKKTMENYMESKVGEAWLGSEFATRLDKHNILSVSIHPGLIRTELQRTMAVPARMMMRLVFKPAVYGAYTELFAGWSPKITSENNGGYILAWGRVEPFPPDILKGLKSEKAGGSGKAKKFLDWVERETKAYI